MARIIVVTSASRMGASDRPTAIWLEEFTTPLYRFLDASHEVTIASPERGAVPVSPATLADEPHRRHLRACRLAGLLTEAEVPPS